MNSDIKIQPCEAAADAQAVFDAAFKRKPLDAEVAKRVHDRAEQVRSELREKGVTNVAAEIVRECRDE